MITYAEKHIEMADLILFRHIERAVSSLDASQMPYPDDISCHMIADAVGDVFGLRVVRGYFLPSYEHSWCETNSGNRIDVYPWGAIGGPTLIVRHIRSLHYFKEDSRVTPVINNEYAGAVEAIKSQLTNFIPTTE